MANWAFASNHSNFVAALSLGTLDGVMSDMVTNIEYQADGAKRGKRAGNGVSETRPYDAQGR